MLFIAIGLTLPPLLFARWAWRARRSVRVGTHPHCRRCDHILFGLPETSERCPECGGDLRETGAVVTGAPRADRVVVVTATVFTIILIALAARAWREVEWTTVRLAATPTSWLVRDAVRGGPSAQELERRLRAGSYDDDEAQLERVMRAFREIKVSARPRARAGDDLWFTKTVGPPSGIVRGTSFLTPFSEYHVFSRLDRYQIGDGPWVRAGHDGAHEPLRVSVVDHSWVKIPTDTRPGAGTVRLVYEFRLVRESREPTALDSKGSPYKPALRETEPPMLVWEEQAEAPLTIVAPGEDDVEVVAADAELRAAVASTVRMGRVQLRDFTAVRGVVIDRHVSGEFEAAWSVEAVRPPVGLALDAFLRDGAGLEVPLGSVAFSPGEHVVTVRNSPTSSSAALGRFSATTGDLVLRPSPSAARETTDLVRIWGEQVVFKGLPVVRQSPPPPATTQP